MTDRRNSMRYKEYTAKIEYHDTDGLFVGSVIDLEDIIAFSGESVKELRKNFHGVVDEYLEWCTELGEKPERPRSSKGFQQPFEGLIVKPQDEPIQVWFSVLSRASVRQASVGHFVGGTEHLVSPSYTKCPITPSKERRAQLWPHESIKGQSPAKDWPFDDNHVPHA